MTIVHASEKKTILAARAATVALAALCMLVANPAHAQDAARGCYLRVSTGFARASVLPSALTSVSNPTKWDCLLYTSPALAPSGAPECLGSTPRPLLSSDYSPGPGFTSSLAAGYDFDRFRVEFEYRGLRDEWPRQAIGRDSRFPVAGAVRAPPRGTRSRRPGRGRHRQPPAACRLPGAGRRGTGRRHVRVHRRSRPRYGQGGRPGNGRARPSNPNRRSRG